MARFIPSNRWRTSLQTSLSRNIDVEQSASEQTTLCMLKQMDSRRRSPTAKNKMRQQQTRDHRDHQNQMTEGPCCLINPGFCSNMLIVG